MLIIFPRLSKWKSGVDSFPYLRGLVFLSPCLAAGVLLSVLPSPNYALAGCCGPFWSASILLFPCIHSPSGITPLCLFTFRTIRRRRESGTFSHREPLFPGSPALSPVPERLPLPSYSSPSRQFFWLVNVPFSSSSRPAFPPPPFFVSLKRRVFSLVLTVKKWGLFLFMRRL